MHRIYHRNDACARSIETPTRARTGRTGMREPSRTAASLIEPIYNETVQPTVSKTNQFKATYNM